MLNVVMLSVIMLSVVMQNVMMLNVAAPSTDLFQVRFNTDLFTKTFSVK